MSQRLFYACDARHDVDGRVHFMFRDLGPEIHTAASLAEALEQIPSVLENRLVEWAMSGRDLPPCTPRAIHEFAVEAQVDRIHSRARIRTWAIGMLTESEI
ncbi:MAG: hypothetical protein ACK4FF_08250 [Limnobacter sp.]|uniref:hypothetical protein n=1 Tax=Limnobacter sp. TaxID=2003368 RepID=UPI00391DD2E0